jgi:hypothetical protein
MRRLVAMSFLVGDGPVGSGLVRFGEITVLSRRNDTGKSRLLGLIETALNRPGECEWVDVFGIGAPQELVEQIDERAEAAPWIDELAEAVEGLGELLELDAEARDARVGLRLDYGSLWAWRYGRSPSELDEAVRDELLSGLPRAGHFGDPGEPVKLEYLGMAQRQVLPEAVVVPATWEAVEREIAGAVLRLCRVLQQLALCWSELEGRAGELASWLDESFIVESPENPYVDGGLSWEWMVEHDLERHTTRIHPAALAACGALERIASGLLPPFVGSEYRLEVRAGQPTEIVRGAPVKLRLMRGDTQLFDAPDDEELALRFGVREAPGGFELWLQLALRETVARTQAICAVLRDAIRKVSRVLDEANVTDPSDWIAWEDIKSAPDPEPHERDEEEAAASERERLTPAHLAELDELKPVLEEALAYLQRPPCCGHRSSWTRPTESQRRPIARRSRRLTTRKYPVCSTRHALACI